MSCFSDNLQPSSLIALPFDFVVFVPVCLALRIIIDGLLYLSSIEVSYLNTPVTSGFYNILFAKAWTPRTVNHDENSLALYTNSYYPRLSSPLQNNSVISRTSSLLTKFHEQNSFWYFSWSISFKSLAKYGTKFSATSVNTLNISAISTSFYRQLLFRWASIWSSSEGRKFDLIEELSL